MFKHHTKQKGKSNCGKERRISFLVPRNTISLNDFLRRCCIRVYIIVGWEFISVYGNNLARRYFHDLLDVLEESLKVRNIFLPDVDFPFQEIVVEFHFIELGIDLSFFQKVELQVFVLFKHFTLFGRCV